MPECTAALYWKQCHRIGVEEEKRTSRGVNIREKIESAIPFDVTFQICEKRFRIYNIRECLHIKMVQSNILIAFCVTLKAQMSPIFCTRARFRRKFLWEILFFKSGIKDGRNSLPFYLQFSITDGVTNNWDLFSDTNLWNVKVATIIHKMKTEDLKIFYHVQKYSNSIPHVEKSVKSYARNISLGFFTSRHNNPFLTIS